MPITKDKIFEGTEIFAIQLANHKSASKLNVEICDPSTAIGQINDESKKIHVLSVHIPSVING